MLRMGRIITVARDADWYSTQIEFDEELIVRILKVVESVLQKVFIILS